MRRAALFFLLFASFDAQAATTPGMQGFANVRHCIMENDANYCSSIITPDSQEMFKRFASYKLMPCLPSDFNYVKEEAKAERITVTANTPADNGEVYIIRLVFNTTDDGPKLSLPASFERGFGKNWQDKIEMSEQLYLMMKQNMGDQLTCDMLNGLVKPK